MPVYLGERTGARILQAGIGLSSVGDDHTGELLTWDDAPAGEMGDCVFRAVGVSFTATNGWNLAIAVYVDGQLVKEETHGGTGATENGQAQVFVKKRGTSIAVAVRTLTRTGQLSFSNISYSTLPLRSWP